MAAPNQGQQLSTPANTAARFAGALFGGLTYPQLMPEMDKILGAATGAAAAALGLLVHKLKSDKGAEYKEATFSVAASEHTPAFKIIRYTNHSRGVYSYRGETGNPSGELKLIGAESSEFDIRLKRENGRDYYVVRTKPGFTGAIHVDTGEGSFTVYTHSDLGVTPGNGTSSIKAPGVNGKSTLGEVKAQDTNIARPGENGTNGKSVSAAAEPRRASAPESIAGKISDSAATLRAPMTRTRPAANGTNPKEPGDTAGTAALGGSDTHLRIRAASTGPTIEAKPVDLTGATIDIEIPEPKPQLAQSTPTKIERKETTVEVRSPQTKIEEPARREETQAARPDFKRTRITIEGTPEKSQAAQPLERPKRPVADPATAEITVKLDSLPQPETKEEPPKLDIDKPKIERREVTAAPMPKAPEPKGDELTQPEPSPQITLSRTPRQDGKPEEGGDLPDFSLPRKRPGTAQSFDLPNVDVPPLEGAGGEAVELTIINPEQTKMSRGAPPAGPIDPDLKESPPEKSDETPALPKLATRANREKPPQQPEQQPEPTERSTSEQGLPLTPPPEIKLPATEDSVPLVALITPEESKLGRTPSPDQPIEIDFGKKEEPKTEEPKQDIQSEAKRAPQSEGGPGRPADSVTAQARRSPSGTPVRIVPQAPIQIPSLPKKSEEPKPDPVDTELARLEESMNRKQRQMEEARNAIVDAFAGNDPRKRALAQRALGELHEAQRNFAQSEPRKWVDNLDAEVDKQARQFVRSGGANIVTEQFMHLMRRGSQDAVQPQVANLQRMYYDMRTFEKRYLELQAQRKKTTEPSRVRKLQPLPPAAPQNR